MYLCSLMVDVSLIPILEMTYVWFGWYIRKMIVTHHGFLARFGDHTNLPLTQSQPYFPPRFQVTMLEIFFLLWKKKLVMFKIHNPCNGRVRVPSISAPGGIACRPQRASITFTEESTGLLFFLTFVCFKKNIIAIMAIFLWFVKTRSLLSPFHQLQLKVNYGRGNPAWAVFCNKTKTNQL